MPHSSQYERRPATLAGMNSIELYVHLLLQLSQTKLACFQRAVKYLLQIPLTIEREADEYIARPSSSY